LSTRLRQAPNRALQWIAAALAAAAVAFLPFVAISLPRGATDDALIGGLALAALAAIAVHVRISPFPARAVLPALAVAIALAGAAYAGAIILVLVAGSCSDEGHIQAGVWISGAFVYLLLGAWGLQRPLRTVWTVPVAVLGAGLWIAALATVLTGSTGACLD
jgi:hypothetical protein